MARRSWTEAVTRMDQTCSGSRGFFWPMSNPLLQGRWSLPTGRTGMGVPPPPLPPRRSTASAALYQPSSPRLRSSQNVLQRSVELAAQKRRCQEVRFRLKAASKINIKPLRRELIGSLCHLESDKKPDFYLIHDESEDDSGRKNARDERRCERCHQYSSKRQRADDQHIHNA
jgi:hypothetical protein